LTISSPKEKQWFLVVVDDKTNIAQKIGIWMPVFGDEYPEKEDINQTIKLMFNLIPPTHDFLSDENRKWQGHMMIKHFFIAAE
jgi:hypothetical protein